MSDSVRPHRRQPTKLPRLWDSPGKNTGVGCHFLLQCVKGKVKVKPLSCVRLSALHGLQPIRLLHPWDFPGASIGVGCHCLLLNKNEFEQTPGDSEAWRAAVHGVTRVRHNLGMKQQATATRGELASLKARRGFVRNTSASQSCGNRTLLPRTLGKWPNAAGSKPPNFEVPLKKNANLGTSLMFQWLRLLALNVGEPGFDPWSGN